MYESSVDGIPILLQDRRMVEWFTESNAFLTSKNARDSSRNCFLWLSIIDLIAINVLSYPIAFNAFWPVVEYIHHPFGEDAME